MTNIILRRFYVHLVDVFWRHDVVFEIRPQHISRLFGRDLYAFGECVCRNGIIVGRKVHMRT